MSILSFTQALCRPSIPVLCYHQVRPDSGMSPEKFGTHLDIIRKIGFDTILLLDLYEIGLYFPEFLKEKDKYSYFLGGNSPLIKIRCDHRGEAAERGRTLLVIRDSYANCFIPFLTDEYDKILAVDFRYFKGGLRKLTADERVTQRDRKSVV